MGVHDELEGHDPKAEEELAAKAKPVKDAEPKPAPPSKDSGESKHH